MKPYSGSSTALSTPLRAQFGGLDLELLDRKAPHEHGVIHEAVLVAAEEIVRLGAAGGLVSFGAYE